MIREFRKIWKLYAIGILWLFGLIWPLKGIKPDGSLEFQEAFRIWLFLLVPVTLGVAYYVLKQSGTLNPVASPLAGVRERIGALLHRLPRWSWMTAFLAPVVVFPFVTSRYHQDVAIFVMIYICLGLGLNIVVGLAGMLDLGYIAFYGIGAYTYALLSVHYGISYWLCLPVAALFAMIGGCVIGYPTLRMRGDYLAIVTLGFGEIVRIVLNNWMSLTNGPNGILRIKPPDMLVPVFADGFGFEHIYLKKLHLLYFVALLLVLFTMVAVYRLNHSRIGRAWESIREDETAAELMGVNTFTLKLLAYAMGAFFGGLAGAFFAARMRFVNPESFTFLESAMVLSMVVLGGMASIPGIVLGAAALIVLPEVFREFESYRMAVFGAAMTFMMVFKPAGLIPARRMGRGSKAKGG